MASVVAKAARLKPEIRLAQALSEYEAILADEQKAKLRGYRQESPPTAADVMRLTAEIDRDAVRTRRSRRCVGPRLYNFLQAVQMFTGVVDIVISGAQSLIASAIWGVVKLSLQLTSSVPSYFEQLSTLFMSIGRTCPRNQEYLLLYPRSVELKEAVCEYFIVSVQLCKQAVLVLKRPLLGQLLSAMSNTIVSDLGGFEQKLSRLAGAVAEEVALASRRLQVQEAEHNLKSRLANLKTSTETKKYRTGQLERRFLHACSTYDHQTAWKQLRKQGNVEWFLKEEAYTEWTTQTVSSVLHCIGTLGSGKSVLTANVVDQLASRDPAPLVVYFFCKYDDAQSLSPRTIIGSITAQILSHLKPDMSEILSELGLNVIGTDEVFDALLRILSQTSSNVRKFCVVIDGVDECKDADAKIVLEKLKRLADESSGHIFHIFCSSRPDVFKWAFNILASDFMLSMSASAYSDEMTYYVLDALEVSLETGRLSIRTPDIIKNIRDTLLQNAHGMYLWVALQLENICSQLTDKAILSALENIPEDLPETFNRILKKLRNTKGNASLTAYSVLLFRIVAAARRPLTLDELREAVSVEQGETAWDPNQLVNDMQKLITRCGSLLVVDEEELTVRFIHHSVRQFLCSRLVDESVKEYRMEPASADLDLGIICVTYLNSDRHISQLVKPKPQLIASSTTVRKAVPSNLAGKLALRLLNNTKDVHHSMRPSLEATGALSTLYSSQIESYNLFLPYALENWLYHTTRLCRTTHPRIWHLWKCLMTGEVKMVQLPWSPEDCNEFGPTFIDFVLKTRQWNLILAYIGRANGLAVKNLKPLYDILKAQTWGQEHSLVTFRDIRQLVKILDSCMDSEYFGYLHLNSSPGLHIAACMGLVESVQWLLENGAAVDLQSGQFNTALVAACYGGHEAIVKLFLENRADVNLQGGSLNTALQAACTMGHETVVKLLLDNGAAVNLQGGKYNTALQATCWVGNEAIVKLLLENGAEVNLQGGEYGTALQAACLGGHEAIVKLLLENGAAVNLQGGELVTPLVTACDRGNESTVKLLLENGADVNLQGGKYGTPLEAAQRSSRHGVVRLLLEHGAIKKRFLVF